VARTPRKPRLHNLIYFGTSPPPPPAGIAAGGARVRAGGTGSRSGSCS
jgi:hypothetical protein